MYYYYLYINIYYYYLRQRSWTGVVFIITVAVSLLMLFGLDVLEEKILSVCKEMQLNNCYRELTP